MQFLLILVLGAAGLLTYGLGYDHLAANWIGARSPALLGLWWGLFATFFSSTLAVVARWGDAPALPAGKLIRPIGILLVLMAVAAAIVGIDSHHAARIGALRAVSAWASQDPSGELPIGFLVCSAMYLASYVIGVIGAAYLFRWVVLQRREAIRFSLARGLLRPINARLRVGNGSTPVARR